MLVAVADTHAILWHMFGDNRLSDTARTFIETQLQNGDQIAVSAITLIEIVYLIEKGRIAAESFSRLTVLINEPHSAFVLIALDLGIAQVLSRVDALQIPDMPDRIIAATALYHAVPIISRDARIQLSNLETIW